jgi:hypothetical protein
MPRPTRKSRRTRNEPPEIVPPKSDEEGENDDGDDEEEEEQESDDVATETAATRSETSETSLLGTRRSKRARKPTARSVSAAAAARRRRRQSASSDDQKSKGEESSASSEGEPDSVNRSDRRKTKRQKLAAEDSLENDEGSGDDEQSISSEDEEGSATPSKASRGTRGSQKAVGRPRKSRSRANKKGRGTKQEAINEQDRQSSDQEEQKHDGSGDDQQSSDSEDGEGAPSKASRSTRQSQKAVGRPSKSGRRATKRSEGTKQDGPSSDSDEQNDDGSLHDQQSNNSEDGDGSAAPSKASRSTRESHKAVGRPRKSRRQAIKKSETIKEDDADDENGESSGQDEQSEAEDSEKNKTPRKTKSEKSVSEEPKEDASVEASRKNRKRPRTKKPLPRADAIRTETLSDEKLSSEGENESDGDSCATSGASITSRNKHEENTRASVSSSATGSRKEAVLESQTKENDDSSAEVGASGKAGKTDESSHEIEMDEAISKKTVQYSEGKGDEAQTKSTSSEKAKSDDKKTIPQHEEDGSPTTETNITMQGDANTVSKLPANDSSHGGNNETGGNPDQTNASPQGEQKKQQESGDGESSSPEIEKKGTEPISASSNGPLDPEGKSFVDGPSTESKEKAVSVDQPINKEKSLSNTQSAELEDSSRKRRIPEEPGNTPETNGADSKTDEDADREEGPRPEKRTRRSENDETDGMKNTNNEGNGCDVEMKNTSNEGNGCYVDRGMGSKEAGVVAGDERVDLAQKDEVEGEKESDVSDMDQVEPRVEEAKIQTGQNTCQDSQHEDVKPDDSQAAELESVVEKDAVIGNALIEPTTHVSNETQPVAYLSRPKLEDGLVVEKSATAMDGSESTGAGRKTKEESPSNSKETATGAQESPDGVQKESSETRKEQILVTEAGSSFIDSSAQPSNKETEQETSEGDQDVKVVPNDLEVAATSTHEEPRNLESSVEVKNQKLEKLEVKRDDNEGVLEQAPFDKPDTASIEGTKSVNSCTTSENKEQVVSMNKASDGVPSNSTTISIFSGDKHSDKIQNELSLPVTGKTSEQKHELDEDIEFVDASEKQLSHEDGHTAIITNSVPPVDLRTNVSVETGKLQIQSGEKLPREETPPIDMQYSDERVQLTLDPLGQMQNASVLISSTDVLKTAADASDDENEQFHDAHMELPSETASPVSPAEKTAIDAGTTVTEDNKKPMPILPELPEPEDSDRVLKEEEETPTKTDKEMLPKITNLDLEKETIELLETRRDKNDGADCSLENEPVTIKLDTKLTGASSGDPPRTVDRSIELRTSSSEGNVERPRALSEGRAEKTDELELSKDPQNDLSTAGVPHSALSEGSGKDSLVQSSKVSVPAPTLPEGSLLDSPIPSSKVIVSASNDSSVSPSKDCVPAPDLSMNSLKALAVSSSKAGVSALPSNSRSSTGRHPPSAHAFDSMKLNRVKTLLYSAGSRVHRGRGSERIFAEYWDAIMLRLSDRLSSHTSESCDRALNAFLRSARLRKLHNNFIKSKCAEYSRCGLVCLY